MQTKATTVQAYLDSIPEDRRASVSAVRQVILKNLDPDFREGMQYGMIGYFIPHERYPAGYHCDPKQPLPYVGLASQKGHMSLHMMGLYIGTGATEDAPWFEKAWRASGKKLDMGKACIRFKHVDDLALEVIAESIRRIPAKVYIERYEQVLRTPPRTGAKPAKPKPTKKSAPAARGGTKAFAQSSPSVTASKSAKPVAKAKRAAERRGPATTRVAKPKSKPKSKRAG